MAAHITLSQLAMFSDRIGPAAFAQCEKLKKVELTVRMELADECFDGCKSLNEFTWSQAGRRSELRAVLRWMRWAVSAFKIAT